MNALAIKGAVDCLFVPPVNPAELTTANPELAGLPCLTQVDSIASEMAQQGIERVLLTPCQASLSVIAAICVTMP